MPRAVDGMKVCSKCGENKPVSEFGNNQRMLDKLHSWCKDCARSADRERRGYKSMRNTDPRPYKYRVIDEQTAAIPVRDKDTWQEAIVDLHNAEWLSQYKWKLHTDGYALESSSTGKVSMHRMILGLKPGDLLKADHINRIPSDNRECNLRVVTHAVNMRNKLGYAKSGFKHVYWHAKSQKWQVKINSAGKDISLGYFDDKIEAARAADRFIIAHFDEHAPTAFPRSEYLKEE